MLTYEEKLKRSRERRSTEESKQKRREYDRIRLQKPEVIERMKQYRMSEEWKEVAKKSQKKIRSTDAYKEKKRQYRSQESYKNKRRNNDLLKKFGITIETYQEMLKNQNNVCSICNTVKQENEQTRLLAVDHDHRTGAIRGLLCRRCNVMIGLSDDNVDLLQSAIIYLNKYGDL